MKRYYNEFPILEPTLAHISDDDTVFSLLNQCVRQSPDRIYASYGSEILSVNQLNEKSRKVAASLAGIGIQPGHRVAVMLDNSLDYVILYFALISLGAIQVPVNTRLRHGALKFLIKHAEPELVIGEPEYLKAMEDADCLHDSMKTIRHLDSEISPWILEQSGPLRLDRDLHQQYPVKGTDILFIMYTSGTTGPPKGVMVTEKMFRASAYGATLSADIRDGDSMAIWEPLYHIGAAQLLPIPLSKRVELKFIGPFSASRFWERVKAVNATHIHFLGGILQILLRQPVNLLDQTHSCRIAWGGGAPPSVAKEFEQRFKIQVREIYGMTEASSFTSINTDGHKGSVGKPAPYFDVKIIDTNDVEVEDGNHGEITVHQLEPGLITPGYYNNPDATAHALRNGRLYTGDLGYFDDSGYLYYAGRAKESIRRRGENISAWEIERVVEQLDWIEQAAAIGVPDELGDEEIKVFVKLSTEDRNSTQARIQILKWCREQLPDFQMPHYLSIVDEFPMTGTQRIRKELLSRSTTDCIKL